MVRRNRMLDHYRDHVLLLIPRDINHGEENVPCSAGGSSLWSLTYSHGQSPSCVCLMYHTKKCLMSTDSCQSLSFKSHENGKIWQNFSPNFPVLKQIKKFQFFPLTTKFTLWCTIASIIFTKKNKFRNSILKWGMKYTHTEHNNKQYSHYIQKLKQRFERSWGKLSCNRRSGTTDFTQHSLQKLHILPEIST